jgi:hypothetical protein
VQAGQQPCSRVYPMITRGPGCAVRQACKRLRPPGSATTVGPTDCYHWKNPQHGCAEADNGNQAIAARHQQPGAPQYQLSWSTKLNPCCCTEPVLGSRKSVAHPSWSICLRSMILLAKTGPGHPPVPKQTRYRQSTNSFGVVKAPRTTSEALVRHIRLVACLY